MFLWWKIICGGEYIISNRQHYDNCLYYNQYERSGPLVTGQDQHYQKSMFAGEQTRYVTLQHDATTLGYDDVTFHLTLKFKLKVRLQNPRVVPSGSRGQHVRGGRKGSTRF